MKSNGSEDKKCCRSKKSLKDEFALLNLKLIKKLYSALCANFAADCRPLLDAYYIHARELCASLNCEDYYIGPHFSRNDINLENIIKKISGRILKSRKSKNVKRHVSHAFLNEKDKLPAMEERPVDPKNMENPLSFKVPKIISNETLKFGNQEPGVYLPDSQQLTDVPAFVNLPSTPNNKPLLGSFNFGTATPISNQNFSTFGNINDGLFKNAFLNSTAEKGKEQAEEEENQVLDEQAQNLSIEKAGYAHYTCVLYYSEDKKWVKLGHGIVNMLHGDQDKSTQLVVRQHPSASGTILLNSKLVNGVTTVTDVSTNSVIFVSYVKPAKGEGSNKPVMLKFTNQEERDEFRGKLYK